MNAARQISVIIPCFNAGPWLDEAVECALAQRDVRVEVIVADDGSTEVVTLACLDRWDASGTVRVLRLPHRGVSAARNAGISVASSSFIMLLDADDLMAPTYGAQAVALMEARPNLGIVTCIGEYIGGASGRCTDETFSMVAFLRHFAPLRTTSAFRKGDWQQVDGFDESLALGEDIDFWFRILGLGREVVRIPRVLEWYRRRPGQVTAQSETEEARLARTAATFARELDLFLTHSDALWAEQTRLNRVLASFERSFGWLDRRLPTRGGAR